MTIYLGSDHAGFAYKEKLKRFLVKRGYDFTDVGNTVLDPGDDYPKFAAKVAKSVAANHEARGILFCDSGVGMCMAANKTAGIRAANVLSIREARQSREHNNANVLCLGQRFLTFRQARRIVRAWLETPFSHEPRHHRRVKQLDALL